MRDSLELSRTAYLAMFTSHSTPSHNTLSHHTTLNRLSILIKHSKSTVNLQNISFPTREEMISSFTFL